MRYKEKSFHPNILTENITDLKGEPTNKRPFIKNNNCTFGNFIRNHNP